MKRSEINSNIQWAKTLLEKHQMALPPFGYWKMKEWHEQFEHSQTIRKVMLGWDITDFGQGDFDAFGAVLFTLRNGDVHDQDCGTPYAEKLILLKEGQRLPLHHHASKTEDIINRAGGVMGIKLYNAKADGTVDYETPVTVALDGVQKTVSAGETLLIHTGASITLRPYMYHLFWAEKGHGDLVCGEVSSINDDRTDNYNAEPVSRFTTVEEDEAILHPLCNEYETVFA